MGTLFQIKAEELVEGKHAPKSPEAVAKGCYTAAVIYILIFLFCFGQVSSLTLELFTRSTVQSTTIFGNLIKACFIGYLFQDFEFWDKMVGILVGK